MRPGLLQRLFGVLILNVTFCHLSAGHCASMDSLRTDNLGATQGTLRYDPISRRRPPDNFRFQYWPWQFPDKIDFQPLSSTLCRPKISGSADYRKSRGE
jgi:hypothetical protein